MDNKLMVTAEGIARTNTCAINLVPSRIRGFEPVVTEKAKQEVPTLLPLRGTKTSAGYDFYTPVDLIIPPQAKLLFWTDVKAYMLEGEVLLLDIRSSMGINHDLMMANTIPVIDSDYHNNVKNDGNIGICIRNLKPSMEITDTAYTHIPIYTSEKIVNEEGGSTDYRLASYDELSNAKLVEMDFPIPIIHDLREGNTVVIKAGERVAQGIFMNYLPSDNCNTEEERKGGLGSTSEQK